MNRIFKKLVNRLEKVDAKRELLSSQILPEQGSARLQKLIIVYSGLVLILLSIWGGLTRIDEVAPATGSVLTKENLRMVQHLKGGIVQKLNVREGDEIQEGQVLLELDATELQFKKARALASVEALRGKKEAFDEEFEARKKLVGQGLNSKLSFLTLQSKRSEVIGELQEAEENLNLVETDLKRMTVKAPVTGRVHNLKFTGVGQVIKPGELITEIVPQDNSLQAEIWISPKDRGYVKGGLEVELKFDSYDFNTYGGIMGRLSQISATTFVNSEGISQYRGLVTIDEPFIVHNNHRSPILPGMTLSADIKTGTRTIIQYLLKPVFKSASSAFKER